MICQGWKPSDDFSYTTQTASGVPFSFTRTGLQRVLDVQFDGRVGAGNKDVVSVLAGTAGSGNPALVYSSQTPDVCTVSATGAVAYTNSGVCKVRVRGKTGDRGFDQTLSSRAPNIVHGNSVVMDSGSLRKYLYDQQIAALASVLPGTTSQRAYTGTTLNSANFLVAPSAAAVSAGFTSLPADALSSLLFTNGATTNSRVWVTPRHYITGIGAVHGTAAGAGLRLFGSDSVIRWSATPYTGTLARILPTNYTDKLQLLSDCRTSLVEGYEYGSLFPCWSRLANTVLPDGTDNPAEKNWVQPVDYKRRPYPSTDPRSTYQQQISNIHLVYGGDSGSPVFCGINGQLILVSHVSIALDVGTDFYGDYVDAINFLMKELATEAGDSGTYVLLNPDLSGFNTYTV